MEDRHYLSPKRAKTWTDFTRACFLCLFWKWLLNEMLVGLKGNYLKPALTQGNMAGSNQSLKNRGFQKTNNTCCGSNWLEQRVWCWFFRTWSMSAGHLLEHGVWLLSGCRCILCSVLSVLQAPLLLLMAKRLVLLWFTWTVAIILHSPSLAFTTHLFSIAGMQIMGGIETLAIKRSVINQPCY